MEPENQQSSQSQPSQQKKLGENCDYEFFAINNEPNSIVMLKKIQDVIPLLVIEPVFILLNCSFKIKERMNQQKLPFLAFDDIDSMIQHIKFKFKGQGNHIEILMPLNMMEEAGEKLGEIPEVKVVHLHLQQDEMNNYYQIYQKMRQNKDMDAFIGKLGKLYANSTIDCWKKKQPITKNKLPNIIYLNEDGWKASIQLRTLFAMVSQANTNKHQIMAQFYQLFSAVYGEHNSQNRELTSIKEIIQKYTAPHSPENILTNNLLRASRNPTEAYYCQPYLKALFEAIRQTYRKQKFTLQYPLECYRGASASAEEIQNFKKNEGQIIQNIGFLSTSTKPGIGEFFAKNLMFVIMVREEERDQELDFGYAKIREYSFYPDEEEVLLNPLNTFRIQKVDKRTIKSDNEYEDDRSVDTVYLTYGSLAQIRQRHKNKNSELGKKEQQYAAQAEYLVSELKARIENQGDVFISVDDYLEGGLQYWKEQMKHEQDPMRKTKILHKMGMGYYHKGNYEEALKKYEQCIGIAKEALGKKNPQYAAILNNTGIIYDQMGKYEKALKNYKECLVIKQEVMGKKHPSYADTLNNIGSTCDSMGRYQEALKNYKECLSIRCEAIGEKNLSYADTLNNIGRTYRSMGKYEEALKNYQKCLEIQQEVLGKTHPSFAETLNNIGNTSQGMGKYQQALKNYKKCLEIQQEALGKMHPSYADTLNNIGSTYDSMGQYEEALKNYEECLEIQQKVLGKKHPSYANALNNIGNVCESMGQYEEALKKYKECLVIKQQTLGKKHPSYADTLNNIGMACDKMGKYQEALNNYQECLLIQQEFLGKRHPSYSFTLNNIGNTSQSMGKYEEALKNYKECLEIQQEALGKNHPLYAGTLNNIGNIYDSMGKYENALKMFKECLGIQQKALGKKHPQYAIILNSIGNACTRMGKYEEALKNFNESLGIQEQILGKKHPDYAIILNSRGNTYKQMGRYQEALKNYKECLTVRQGALGKHHPDYAGTLNNIGTVYYQTGRYEQALRMFQQGLNISQNSLGQHHPQCKTISHNLRVLMIHYNELVDLYRQVFPQDEVNQVFSEFYSGTQ